MSTDIQVSWGLVILLHEDKERIIEFLQLSGKYSSRSKVPGVNEHHVVSHCRNDRRLMPRNFHPRKTRVFGPRTDQISFIRTNHPHRNSPPSTPWLYHLGSKLSCRRNAGFAYRWKGRCRPSHPSYRGKTTGMFDHICSRAGSSIVGEYLEN